MRDRKDGRVRGGYLISPWTDVSLSTASWKDPECNRVDKLLHNLHADVKLITGGNLEKAKLPTYSPLFADLTGLPPLLIQASNNELLRDDSIEFAKLAKEAGVEVNLKMYDKQQHDFQLFWEFVPESSHAIDEAVEFITTI